MSVELKKKVATCIYDTEEFTCIRYHNTEVVKFNREKIILNSDGWFTKTTKKRMNQANTEYNLGFFIRQEKNQWYVVMNHDTIPFVSDNIELERMPIVLGL